jgi:DNA-binding beta-propeller fold protein YncE
LRELEDQYHDELVVVGVHAGKFRAERVTANIAAAAQRLGVEHPIVNDRQFRIWRSFGVGAWPTVVLVDPAGGVVGALPGEFLAGQLAPTLDGLIAEFDREDAPDGARLRRGPAPLSLPPAPHGPLAYPGKVLAGPGRRLFVADTGHHRVLELDVELESSRAHVVRTVGSGRRGAADGSAAAAAFDHPEGMAFTPGRLGATGLAFTASAETLFVADAGNHLVRAVDLLSGTVSTVAGTGRQARRSNEPGVGTAAALNSPWDVELLPARPDSTLSLSPTMIVAMAGTHQLWRVDLVTRHVEPWVGTGREDITDGPPFRCTLAQPVSLRRWGSRLYFADCESSAIRFVDLEGRDGPEVQTILGTGLFDFGDKDGQGGHARLQHPYDVKVFDDGTLVLADTYNNKLKRLDPATKVSQTFAGTGEPGLEDGALAGARFWEPQGVSVRDGVLYVADTNNHVIRTVSLTADGPPVVRTLTIG